MDLERMDLDHRVPLSRPAEPPRRHPGLHLSGVLKHTLESSRMPGWDRYSKELDEQKIPLIWALGHAWEEFVASLYPEWIWQPGETSRVFGSCRVYMNCDGLSPDPRGMTIEEAKYTSCAVRTGAEFLNDWLKIDRKSVV